MKWSSPAAALCLGLPLSLGFPLAAARADVTLPSLFSDNVVLQRSAPVPVWGTADPGERVTVSVAGKSAAATAGPDGHWRVDLSGLPAGDNDTLTITGKNTLTIKNVDVGEVWLASGQSNMTMHMGWDLKDYAKDAAAANDPDLRMFTVPTRGSLLPETAADGRWFAADPKNALDFSAVGYYFAKNLRQELGVPVGIIHSSYGGTPGEAWVSRAALDSDPALRQRAEDGIAAMERLPEDTTQFPIKLDAWEMANGARDAGETADPPAWAAPPFDDGAWQKASLPASFDNLGLKAGGVLCLRKSVILPADAGAKDFDLYVGWNSNVFRVYFNGQVLKPNSDLKPFYGDNQYFHVPHGLVRPGAANVVALREYGLTAGSGLWIPAKAMGLPASPSALDGPWAFRAEQTFPALTPAALAALPGAPASQIQNTPGALFNAMIHPLIPYAIKGCLWYQGESNAGDAGHYRGLLTDLIADWRGRWGEGRFPFEVEQLANYGGPPAEPGDSGVAGVREAQLRVAQTVPDTGLAVAIDLGNPDGNIHPADKWDVGRRLSLVALSNAYGKPVIHSGPIYAGMKVAGSTVTIAFRHADGGLAAPGGPLQRFAVAGGDKKFVWADARIAGDTVVVSSPRVPQPVAVRYAWADNPVGCNLYNGAGLPASPFRTDDWQP